MCINAAQSIYLCRTKAQSWLHCVPETCLCACECWQQIGDRFMTAKPWTACRTSEAQTQLHNPFMMLKVPGGGCT